MGDRDPHISSSEIESLSDSEWLDLSSHASEVSDLLESDVEDPFSRPHSPHSTSSLSERNEGPDRWEGVLEAEDADESSSDDGDAEDDSDGLANPIGVNLQGTIRARDIVRHRLVEDVREREALEQSMVSTLSTSRSNSLTASASTTGSRTRDLRLSFPDPLTPPRDELNRSYDNVQADDVYSTPNPLLPLALGPEVGVTSISASAEGPVRAIATEVLQSQPSAQPDFEIVLYGSHSSNKFILVESLLGKLATRSGLNLSKRLPLAPRLSTYLLDVKSKPFASVLSVQIIDNTEAEMMPVCGELPSLAIIFLPHFLPSLPRHDLYLPVVETQRGPSDISDSNEGFSTDLLRGGVERQWDMLRTPMMQTLLWHVDSPTTVLSLDEITALDATEVALGFEPLIPRRRRFANALRAQIASAPAMTFIAILSIVLGYIVSMSSSMALPAPAEREVVAAAVKAFANTTQISSAILTPASVTIQQPIAIMSPLPISLSTVAPSTHDQLAPVLTPTAEPHAMPKVSQSLNPIAHSSQTRSLSLTLSSTKSLSVAPSTIKSVAVPHAATYELSSRLASTFQDLFSPVAIRADMKELLNALEELLRVLAFNTQTTLNMLNVADNLRDNLRRRHRRAQERARRLRDKGAEAFIGASKRVSERMDIARRRAKALQTQFGDETRAMVKRAQRRWAEGQRVST